MAVKGVLPPTPPPLYTAGFWTDIWSWRERVFLNLGYLLRCSDKTLIHLGIYGHLDSISGPLKLRYRNIDSIVPQPERRRQWWNFRTIYGGGLGTEWERSCRADPPVYVAWRAGTTTLRIPTRFLAPIDCSKEYEYDFPRPRKFLWKFEKYHKNPQSTEKETNGYVVFITEIFTYQLWKPAVMRGIGAPPPPPSPHHFIQQASGQIFKGDVNGPHLGYLLRCSHKTCMYSSRYIAVQKHAFNCFIAWKLTPELWLVPGPENCYENLKKYVQIQIQKDPTKIR